MDEMDSESRVVWRFRPRRLFECSWQFVRKHHVGIRQATPLPQPTGLNVSARIDFLDGLDLIELKQTHLAHQVRMTNCIASNLREGQNIPLTEYSIEGIFCYDLGR